MLPEDEPISDEAPETFVTEETYEVIRLTLTELFAQYDTYLDVFVAEMKYSDTPVTKSISEDLADIYQDIKNFVTQFQIGINETMHDAILECSEHFRLYWGQTLVNTLRALHELEYNTTDDDANEESPEDEDF